jgi:hypothetical protein
VIAALGSSALTGIVAFGLEWWRSKKADKSTQAERRSHAYSILLTRSTIIAHLASDLHMAMKLKSGLTESLNVAMGITKKLDPLELADRLRAELQPLYEAWTEVWMVGSKEAIPVANDLVNRCGEVMGTATQKGEARPLFLKVVVGEKWTQKQLDQWQNELRGLAEARKRLGIIARKELGVEVADLFATNELNHPKTLEAVVKSSTMNGKPENGV